MIRTLNFAFIAITGFVCLGPVPDRGGSPCRAGQPARDEGGDRSRAGFSGGARGRVGARDPTGAISRRCPEKHLPLSDVPVAQVSSLSLLPQKAPPVAPDFGLCRPLRLSHRQKHVTRKARTSPARDENAIFAEINTGT